MKTSNNYRDKLLNNEVRLSQGDIKSLAKKSKEEIDFIIEKLEEGGKEVFNYRTACFAWDRYQTKLDAQKSKTIHAKLNTVIKGDAATVLKEFPEKTVSMILTDSPYGTNINYEYPDTTDEALSTLDEVCVQLKRVLKDNGHAYFFFSDENEDEFRQVLSKYFTIEKKLLWHKQGMKPSKDKQLGFVNYIEPFFFCSKKGCEPKALSKKYPPNIFNIKVETHNKKYTARKPVKLMKEIIKLSSEKGDIIVDTYCGTAPVAQAAIETGRQFIAIDISPKAEKLAKENVKKSEEKRKKKEEKYKRKQEMIERRTIKPESNNNQMRNTG